MVLSFSIFRVGVGGEIEKGYVVSSALGNAASFSSNELSRYG